MADELVPPSVMSSPQGVLRRVHLAIYYSLGVQVCTWIYILIDTLVLNRFPPQRTYSMIILGANLGGILLGRILNSGRLVSIVTPLSMLGMVTVGSLSNGGIFGPIPSCFALSLMITIAMTDIRTAKIIAIANIGILGLLVYFAKSPFISPISPSVWTYFMINVVMLLTTFGFFSIYETEQQRLRALAQEHHRLQTISKVIATLNHEINTPLNSALIAVQMLQDFEKRSQLRAGSPNQDSQVQPLTEKPAVPLGTPATLGSPDPWVDHALEGLRQIQRVIKQISEIEPEQFEEDDYRSQSAREINSKIYKVIKPNQEP